MNLENGPHSILLLRRIGDSGCPHIPYNPTPPDDPYNRCDLRNRRIPSIRCNLRNPRIRRNPDNPHNPHNLRDR